MRSAAATASSTVVTASPRDTGMPKPAKKCLPWYSKRSMGRQATDPRSTAAKATVLDAIAPRDGQLLRRVRRGVAPPPVLDALPARDGRLLRRVRKGEGQADSRSRASRASASHLVMAVMEAPGVK